MPGAEDELLHCRIEPGISDQPHVRLGRLTFDQRRLRLAHRRENRRLATLVAIDPNAEVHLARIGIRAVGGHQTENRVVGKLLKRRSNIGSPGRGVVAQVPVGQRLYGLWLRWQAPWLRERSELLRALRSSSCRD